MKVYNVTMLNKNAEECSICDMYQQFGKAPLCPDHEQEMMNSFDNHDCHASPEDGCKGCEEFDSWEDCDKYFANNYGDMLDFQLDSIVESDSWRS